jgi:D-serine deaminase-like pyridoxal phosphate-dependent protein
MQVGLGVATPDDCALTVLTTVVSNASREAGIVDAGSKALSSDRGVHGAAGMTGYGLLRELPGIAITALSEEHGWLTMDSPARRLDVGERIRIVPNHACATAANFDRLLLVSAGTAIEEATIARRRDGRLDDA